MVVAAAAMDDAAAAVVAVDVAVKGPRKARRASVVKEDDESTSDLVAVELASVETEAEIAVVGVVVAMTTRA